MLFTNGQIYGLREVLKEFTEIDVPAKVGIKIARLVKMLLAEISIIDETRQKLIRKYGEDDVQGGIIIKPDSANWIKFAEEFNEMMGAENKLEFEKVVLPPDTKIGIKLLVMLEPFLEVADD